MKVICQARQEGKTTKIIIRAAATGGYIVCQSPAEAFRIYGQAKKMGLDINFPITFTEFLNGAFQGKNISAFHIDNVDTLLSLLARGIPIDSISLTKDEDNK